MDVEQKEFESMITKKVLEGAVLPRGKKLLKTKWVYVIKIEADVEIKSFRERLVSCGYAQIFGVDFGETYSPVASLHIIFAIATQLWFQLYQINADKLILNTKLAEDIFILPPEGFPLPPGIDCF